MTTAPTTDPMPAVITEILAGDSLSMNAAAHRVPAHRGTGSAVPSTIWRWHRHGAKSPDGRRVHLEMARVGGKWMTSAAALARFLAALTPPTPGQPARQTVRTQRQRETRAQRAGKKLERMGA
jgi:hypothetical protein